MSKKSPFLNKQQIAIIIAVLGMMGFLFLETTSVKIISMTVFVIAAVALFSK